MLNTDPNLSDPDGLFEALVEAHRDLTPEASRRLDAKLVLLLANHIGDVGVVLEAIAAARRGFHRLEDPERQHASNRAQDAPRARAGGDERHYFRLAEQMFEMPGIASGLPAEGHDQPAEFLRQWWEGGGGAPGTGLASAGGLYARRGDAELEGALETAVDAVEALPKRGDQRVEERNSEKPSGDKHLEVFHDRPDRGQ